MVEHFAVSIPLPVLKICQEYKPSALENRVMNMKRSNQSCHPLVALWLQNTDQQNYASFSQRLLTFPSYLKNYWQLKSIWLLPVISEHRMGRYMLRRLRHAIKA